MLLLTTYIPKFDDWKSLGMVNNNLTWLAIKPEAQVLLFRNHEHYETYYFEKCSRIYNSKIDYNGQLAINPMIKRVAVA